MTTSLHAQHPVTKLKERLNGGASKEGSIEYWLIKAYEAGDPAYYEALTDFKNYQLANEPEENQTWAYLSQKCFKHAEHLLSQQLVLEHSPLLIDLHEEVLTLLLLKQCIYYAALGVFYQREANYTKAQDYLVKAGPEGKAHLAQLYIKGIGLIRDPALALKLIEEGETEGDTNCAYILGVIYATGKYLGNSFDIKVDIDKAIQYLHKAKDHPAAYFFLGQLYANKLIIPSKYLQTGELAVSPNKNLETAEVYFQKALKFGHPFAAYALITALSLSQETLQTQAESALAQFSASDNEMAYVGAYCLAQLQQTSSQQKAKENFKKFLSPVKSLKDTAKIKKFIEGYEKEYRFASAFIFKESIENVCVRYLNSDYDVHDSPIFEEKAFYLYTFIHACHDLTSLTQEERLILGQVSVVLYFYQENYIKQAQTCYDVVKAHFEFVINGQASGLLKGEAAYLLSLILNFDYENAKRIGFTNMSSLIDNPYKSAEWLKKAADFGHPVAKKRTAPSAMSKVMSSVFSKTPKSTPPPPKTTEMTMRGPGQE
jgi:TPR repeat protein